MEESREIAIAESIHDKEEEYDFPDLEDECDILVHPVADLPIPYGIEEKQNEMIFLDPSIGEGKRLISDKTTTIPQLFAVMRQFLTPVCNNVGIIVDEMLRRGVGVNDIDSTTGMTMLHYAIRGAALSEKYALVVIKRLLCSGADPSQRCMYTDMNALHMAAYFDVPSVARLLLKSCDLWSTVAVDSLCDNFDYGTSLHIAASCLACRVSEVLLQKGACHNSKDDQGRTPEQCIPTNLQTPDERMKANHIREMLHRYGDSPRSTSKHSSNSESSKLVLGSRVTFAVEHSGEKDHQATMKGTLRYLGSLPSSTDEWAGIELDAPDGRNSGNLGKQTYFNCKKDHGIFVPASTVTSLSATKKSSKRTTKKSSKDSRRKSNKSPCEFVVGNRVTVAGSMVGIIRYVGTTQFASGTWCGVELDGEGPGRNDGSVGGIPYFTCAPSRGVFAPPSKISLLAKDSDQMPVDRDSSGRVQATVSDPYTSTGSTPRRTDNRRRTPSAEASASKSGPSGAASAPCTPDAARKQRGNSADRIKSAGSTPAKPPIYLRPGLRVDLCGSEQSAVVKFVGATDFAAGAWVGLDLGTAQGKNDGSVKGRRYFNCPPKHGLMLRPGRVSHKGVNGISMLPPQLAGASQEK